MADDLQSNGPGMGMPAMGLVPPNNPGTPSQLGFSGTAAFQTPLPKAAVEASGVTQLPTGSPQAASATQGAPEAPQAPVAAPVAPAGHLRIMEDGKQVYPAPDETSGPLLQASMTAQVDPNVAAQVAAAGIHPAVVQATANNYPSVVNPADPHSAAPFVVKDTNALFQAVVGRQPTTEEAVQAAQQGPAAVAVKAATSPPTFRVPNGSEDARGLYVMNRLITQHGWTSAAAAIAVGNLKQESGIRSDGPMGDPSTPGGSWGMAQWNRGRLDALKTYAGQQGKHWQDFDTQVDFLAQEAEKTVPGWKGQQDLSQAGAISHAYEGYGDNSTGTREANAQHFLSLYTGHPIPEGVTWSNSTPSSYPTHEQLALAAAQRAQNASGVAGATFDYVRNDSLAKNIMQDARDYSQTPDPNWKTDVSMLQQDDRFNALPDHLKDQGGYLLDSVSRQDYENRLQSLQDQASYERRMADSGFSGAIGRGIGSLIDPVGWAPMALSGGTAEAGILARALREGAVWGSAGLAEEAYRQRHDLNTNAAALAYGAAMGGAFGLGMGAAHGAFHPAIKAETQAGRGVLEGVANKLEAQAEGRTPAEALKASEAPVVREAGAPAVVNGEAAADTASDVGAAVAASPTRLDPDVYGAGVLHTMRELDPATFTKARALEDQIDWAKATGQEGDVEGAKILASIEAERNSLTPKLAKLQAAAEEHMSTMGIKPTDLSAAAYSGHVEPLRDINAVDSSAFTQDHAPNAAFAKYRLDLAGRLQQSRIPLFKAVGSMLVRDSVGNADRSLSQLDVASATKRGLSQRLQAEASSIHQAGWRNWAQDNGLNIRQRLTGGNYDAFGRSVYDEIKKPGSFADKHIVSTANGYRKIYKELADLANDPSMGDGTVRAPIKGAPESDPDYAPRIWAGQKFREAVAQYGDAPMKRLVRASVAAADSMKGAEPELVDKITNAFFKGIRDVQAGLSDVHLSRLLNGEDMDGLAGLLKDHGMTQEDVDAVLGQVGKPSPNALGEGPIGRLKNRTPMDTSVRLGMPDGKGLALDDLIDRDILGVTRQYIPAMSGQIALARVRVNTPEELLEGFNPEEREANQHIVDGLQTDADVDKMVKLGMAQADANGVPLKQAQHEADLIRGAINGLKGVMEASDKGMMGTVSRTLRNYSFARVAGLMGFSHASLAAKIMAQTGLKAAWTAMPVFRSFMRDAVTGQLNEQFARDIEQLFAPGTDIMRGWREGSPVDEYGNYAQTYGKAAAFESASQQLARGAAMAGGIAPIMTGLQRWAARAAVQRLALDATGEQSLDGMMHRMAVFGFGPEERKLVAEQFQKNVTGSGTDMTLNLDKWNSKARFIMQNVVQTWAEKMAQTNDPGMMIAALGTNMGKFLTQFRTFQIGSYANSTLHMLHMRDGAVAGEFFGSSVAGAMAYMARTYLTSVGRDDQDQYLQKHLSWEHLAAASVHYGSWASVLPTAVDMGLYAAGSDPMFQSIRSTGDASNLLMSIPAAGTISSGLNAMRGVAHIVRGDGMDRTDLQNMLSPLPFQNVLPMTWAANGLMRGMPWRDPFDDLQRR